MVSAPQIISNRRHWRHLNSAFSLLHLGSAPPTSIRNQPPRQRGLSFCSAKRLGEAGSACRQFEHSAAEIVTHPDCARYRSSPVIARPVRTLVVAIRSPTNCHNGTDCHVGRYPPRNDVVVTIRGRIRTSSALLPQDDAGGNDVHKEQKD